MSEPVRLNRYIASCGVCSRRYAEEHITAGRVTVNGIAVTSLSTKVTEDDSVCFDGLPVRPTSSVTLVMNKPRGVVCALKDTRYRTVIDLLPGRIRRLRPFPVGRLDRDSEGLLIITNDGDMAMKISHPSGGILKRYHVSLDAPLTEEERLRILKGVHSDGEFLRPLDVQIEDICAVVTLCGGRKREVRRIMKAQGHEVKRLVRISIGKLELVQLPRGSIKEFSSEYLWSLIKSGGAV